MTNLNSYLSSTKPIMWKQHERNGPNSLKTIFRWQLKSILIERNSGILNGNLPMARMRSLGFLSTERLPLSLASRSRTLLLRDSLPSLLVLAFKLRSWDPIQSSSISFISFHSGYFIRLVWFSSGQGYKLVLVFLFHLYHSWVHYSETLQRRLTWQSAAFISLCC